MCEQRRAALNNPPENSLTHQKIVVSIDSYKGIGSQSIQNRSISELVSSALKRVNVSSFCYLLSNPAKRKGSE